MAVRAHQRQDCMSKLEWGSRGCVVVARWQLRMLVQGCVMGSRGHVC